jgi:serine protease Do/serine protease DegQ
MMENADEIEVTLADGRRLQGNRLGADPEMDVAVIQVSATGLVAITLGDSDKVEVGDFVVAIGNPFGLGQTVTAGIVSALRRSGLGIEGYEDFIQTDAAINPGNSGGALINLRGELVGINTAIVGPGGGNIGIGFAIPINMVAEVLDQLVRFGEVRRGQLGIVIEDLTADVTQTLGLGNQRSGAVISAIEPGSAADRAGLQVGDVIIAVGGRAVRDASDLRNKIGVLEAGKIAKLTVRRARGTLTMRAAPTTLLSQLLQGGELSPLLDGAMFESMSTGAFSGVEVGSVRPGSAASTGGLLKGDIVALVNEEPVAGPNDFVAKVKKSPKRLFLDVVRDSDTISLLLRE